MNETEFMAFAAQNAAAEQHAEEIRATRVGGLGGSDAALVLKIGQSGLSALNNTDLKRLAVMLGTEEQEEWAGNAYTNAGHRFEDYMAAKLLKDPHDGECKYAREERVEQRLAVNFKTFAHADFITTNGATVLECKYVTKTKDTEKVAQTYAAQLQWYYMLGVRKVVLVHGWGTVEDTQKGTEFHPEGVELREIERNDSMIEQLTAGIKLLDTALQYGWRPTVLEKMDKEQTPSAVQSAYEELARAKRMAVEAKELEQGAKDVLMDYMVGFGCQSIADAENGTRVQFVKAKQTQRFDLETFKKLLQKSGFDNVEQVLALVEKAYKTTNVSATLMFK